MNWGLIFDDNEKVDLNCLDQLFSEEEILQAIKDLPADKTPRPYELLPFF